MKISYRPFVRIDLIEAKNYYNTINANLAKQFLLNVKQTKNLITKNPLHFSVKYNSVRTALLKQFPYHIHFFIDEDKNRIVIIAIVYAGKDFIDYAKR